jgi:hypothetical protein
LTDFPKISKISNLIKIRPVGAELFHADGQTDTTKLIVAFRNFAKAPNVSGKTRELAPAPSLVILIQKIPGSIQGSDTKL